MDCTALFREHSVCTGFNSHSQQNKQGPPGAREIPLQTQYQPREQPKISMLVLGHFHPPTMRTHTQTSPRERRGGSLRENRHLEGLTQTERDS